MRFSPNFLDEIRARLPVSQVVGRKVALKKAGREYRGLSPFKVEKSPSFFVNDQKGFYHCFASGEHGDIFTFVMKTEGLEFPEAVERLAAEAGVPMPKTVERNVEQEDQRDRLYRLLEVSAEFFETALRLAQGAEARRYLEKRGLAQETIKSFRLGFAPNSRTALGTHLRAKGFSNADMVTAGMLISGQDIPEPYDRFRNRVMFPILDLKGRVIAFGGRALDKDAQAKYLNSPETPLFHKGHILFNAARARTASHDKNRVIVVEGYMDVVSLAEAGFGETVAPLGTALTEDQLKLLWRFAPEPILCFDGDSAGQKAADRAVEVALPGVKPGHSVSFAFLPTGLDPDDLIRQQGAGAMTTILEKTRPLIDVLWERELKAQPIATPEQRAALDARLNSLTASIQDAAVRNHYARELRDRLYQLGRERSASRFEPRGNSPRGFSSYARPVAAPDWRQRERHRLGGANGERRKSTPRDAFPGGPLVSAELASHVQSISPREALIMKTLLNHPWLIDDHSEAIASIEFAAPSLSILRDEILALHARQNSLDSATLRTQLSKSGVAKVVDLVAQTITHASDRFAESDASVTDVEAAWHHILALHQRQVVLGLALKAAEEAWYRDCTEEAEIRLLDIKRQIASEAAMDQMDEEFDRPDDDAPVVKRAG
ncbi:DNA primase [Hyphomicrobium sp.]|uniref:DNA primase n=1 Tax=Hyphomicrobium sp. TaxID=82 RepID=UPI000F91D65F|nr:DNA primase [Hyphomicrobium sp.]RUO98979.1 MAG: DNA primase [Hyphomicrobium sp.]